MEGELFVKSKIQIAEDKHCIPVTWLLGFVSRKKDVPLPCQYSILELLLKFVSCVSSVLFQEIVNRCHSLLKTLPYQSKMKYSNFVSSTKSLDHYAFCRSMHGASSVISSSDFRILIHFEPKQPNRNISTKSFKEITEQRI